MILKAVIIIDKYWKMIENMMNIVNPPLQQIK